MYPGKTVDMVDCIQQYEAENLADARDGLPQIQGVGIMLLGGFHDGAFHLAKQPIIIPDK